MKTTPAQHSSRQRHLPSILDRELGDRSKDAFGHRHFAKALEGLIEDETKKSPFSIGLLGTGKSTIKELYLEELKSNKAGQDGRLRRDRIFPITFNAWRHGGEEDLKRECLAILARVCSKHVCPDGAPTAGAPLVACSGNDGEDRRREGRAIIRAGGGIHVKTSSLAQQDTRRVS